MTTTTKTKTKAKKTVQQLKLVPDTIEQGVLRSVTLDQLPKQLPGDPPSQPFINTVRDFGVIQPIILIEGSQGFTVCGGRNRIKASRLLGLTEIQAIVYPDGWVSPSSLALIENAHRRQNALSDLLAITDLAASGYDDEAISTQLGISKRTIKARLRLRNLAPELAQALNEGKANGYALLCQLPIVAPEDQLPTFEQLEHRYLQIASHVQCANALSHDWVRRDDGVWEMVYWADTPAGKARATEREREATEAQARATVEKEQQKAVQKVKTAKEKARARGQELLFDIELPSTDARAALTADRQREHGNGNGHVTGETTPGAAGDWTAFVEHA